MKASKGMISLENYIDFVSSDKELRLTRHSLYQIISIHGFRKPYKAAKGALYDAVKTLDLMDPSRSTLKSNILASAPLEEEEIIRDLNRLQWLECCITSIQTLNSSPEQQSTREAEAKAHAKAKSKRKRSAREAFDEGADSISSALVPLQSS